MSRTKLREKKKKGEISALQSYYISDVYTHAKECMESN